MKEVVAPTAFWQQQPVATVVELFSQAGITLAQAVSIAREALAENRAPILPPLYAGN